MQEKIRISLPIIVEGRYDKSTLSSIFDATVIPTDGFRIFNSAEKRALIRKLGEKNGVILLTDSDGGGRQIRSFLSGILPKEKIKHLYIPEIEGKEKRKKTASKAGLLGVEGMTREVLLQVFAPFINEEGSDKDFGERVAVTKLDFYNDGLSGGEGAQEKRKMLAKKLGLPSDMSANALIEAINLISDRDEYKKIISEI